MNKVVVPYNPSFKGLEPDNVKFQDINCNKKRQILLNELRSVPSILKIAKTLNQDSVYKLVTHPDGAKLYKDSAGNIKGVFYKEGKILEHAKFKTIKPSLIKAASVVGSQILLTSIAMQLYRIEKGQLRITEELHNDRIAEIISGVNLYNQCMLVKGKEAQLHLIGQAIQTLNTGIGKTIRSLKTQIEDLPDIKARLTDNWLKDKSKIAEEKMRLAEESFRACIIGIKILAECYSVMDEEVAAGHVLEHYFSSLLKIGLENAAQKARLIEYTVGDLPEDIWNNILKYKPRFLDDIKSYKLLSGMEYKCVEVELKPKELLRD
jgi:hypothetical protein